MRGLARCAVADAPRPGYPTQHAEDRRKQIGKEVHTYCALDKKAMIRIWEVFTGQKELAD